MASENRLVEALRAWILAQEVSGYALSSTSTGQVRLGGAAHTGEVNFYELEGDATVAEMRIVRRVDDENVFFLHFMLDELLRAKELFGEMSVALTELASGRKDRLGSVVCGIIVSTMRGGLQRPTESGELDVSAREPHR